MQGQQRAMMLSQIGKGLLSYWAYCLHRQTNKEGFCFSLTELNRSPVANLESLLFIKVYSILLHVIRYQAAKRIYKLLTHELFFSLRYN